MEIENNNQNNHYAVKFVCLIDKNYKTMIILPKV